jgi:hypothetical protein
MQQTEKGKEWMCKEKDAWCPKPKVRAIIIKTCRKIVRSPKDHGNKKVRLV